MPEVELNLQNIIDEEIKVNFDKLREFINEDFVLARFDGKFFEVAFTGAGTNALIAHGLGFIPKDVIHLSQRNSDSATVTYNYDDFTDTYMSITVSAATTVRFYVGSYRE